MSNVRAHTTLLDDLDVGQPKWHVHICGRGFNRSVLEGMMDISSVNVLLKTHSGNFVCLFDLILYVPSTIFQFNRLNQY